MTRASSCTRAALTASIAALAAGCVIIPYPVAPDIERIEEVRLAADVVVSAAPRRLLEGVSERLEKANDELTVVDPIAFRDAAFPEGGWRVDDLLQPGRCQAVAKELDVRFLVLIGGGAVRARDEMGIMAPLMMPLGAMTMGETSVLSAVVVDLESGETACRVRSQAEGTGAMFAWVMAVVAIAPMTGSAAERGLARAITDAIADEGVHGPMRVAVLAAEASGDPFASYEGAPVTTGRDVEVGAMVNRLANVEDDVVVGVTGREDIRHRLGEPLASQPALRVEVYRLAARAAREIRPLFVGGDLDWAARQERAYAGYLLVVYDDAGAVVDVDTAFVASLVASPDAHGPLDSESRSAYEYVFEPSAALAVTGFRLAVESVDEGTVEVLRTEPDGGVVYQNGEWTDDAAP